MPAVVAVVSLGLIASCADDSTDAETNEPTTGVSVNLLQGRAAYGSREMKIQVVNESDRLLEVERATYDSSRFVEPAVWDDGTRIPAGFTIDLTVTMPESRCEPGDGTDESVTLDLREDGGDPEEETYRPTELYDSIQNLVDADCARREIESIADVRLADDIEIRGKGRDSVAELPILIDPTGEAGSFTLDSIEATTLLSPTDRQHTWRLDVSVDGESDPLRPMLRIVPTRCDSHALADNSQGTEFATTFTLQDGTTTEVVLGTSNRLEGSLTTYVAEHCDYRATDS